jgi:plastocyanin
MKEKIAAISILILIVAIPITIGWYQHTKIAARHHVPGVKVFDITGVTGNGAWTLEKVSGLNYWWKSFTPMTLYLDVGEDVILHIRSADVFHQFYVPGLNLGPIDVKPGHYVEVEFKAVKAGVYQYYCTSLCGECHFYMSGWIVVTPQGQTPVHPEPIVCPLCFPGYDKPPEEDMVDLGEYFYLKLGCVTCHGIEGRGGVTNYNYINKTVPAHNTTAEKFFLTEEEYAEAFIDLVQKHTDLDQLQEQPDIPRFNIVLTRFKAAKELIKNGSHCAKLDMAGPEPPLQMPAWQAMLTERDRDAISLYFISLQYWEEDEEYEDEDEPIFEENDIGPL